jgi:hypothetical protein
MSDILQDFPNILELKKLIMLTSQTVWKREITVKDIDKWLDNFTGEVLSKDEENVLALWLLANFVYYNEDEVRHLCRVLMKDFIHKMLIDVNTQQDEVDKKLSEIISKTRFLLLGKPSESGGYILYYFRTVNDLHISYFNPPQSNELDLIDNIVFIDDVTLTAGPDGQAYRQLKKGVESYKNKRIILLTLIASESSITELRKIGVEVIATITLDERNKCFCANSDIFHTYPNYIESCKKFALHYGNKIDSEIPLGYKGGEYAFGFYYNTPDNTLPIFWGTSNGWCPTFKRYDKNYERKELEINDRFL